MATIDKLVKQLCGVAGCNYQKVTYTWRDVEQNRAITITYDPADGNWVTWSITRQVCRSDVMLVETVSGNEPIESIFGVIIKELR